MPRMRTLEETYKYLKAADPDTCLTPYSLRRMVKQGDIPAIKSGKKYLLNLDLLDVFFNKEIQPPNNFQAGSIRRINEK